MSHKILPVSAVGHHSIAYIFITNTTQEQFRSYVSQRHVTNGLEQNVFGMGNGYVGDLTHKGRQYAVTFTTGYPDDVSVVRFIAKKDGRAADVMSLARQFLDITKSEEIAAEDILSGAVKRTADAFIEALSVRTAPAGLN